MPCAVRPERTSFVSLKAFKVKAACATGCTKGKDLQVARSPENNTADKRLASASCCCKASVNILFCCWCSKISCRISAQQADSNGITSIPGKCSLCKRLRLAPAAAAEAAAVEAAIAAATALVLELTGSFNRGAAMQRDSTAINGNENSCPSHC